MSLHGRYLDGRPAAGAGRRRRAMAGQETYSSGSM
jgi:hypothetical protein